MRVLNGHAWLSPSQHESPAPATSPLPALPTPNPLDELSPLQQEEELWWLAGCPDDLAGLELRATEEAASEERDHVADHLRTGDTRWSLDLDDPYAWQDDVCCSG